MDRHTPAFSIRVNDKPISEDILRKVLSYEYDDSETVDKLTVQFDNFDLIIGEDDFFTPGHLIWTKFGYVEELSPDRLSVLRNISGFKEITIEGFEAVKKFDSESKERVFEDVTLNELVSKITGEHNLKYEVEERKDITGVTLKFDYIQPGIPDLSFLASVGKQIGYRVWIDGRTLFFMPRKYWQSPMMKFVYYGSEGDVLDFEPEVKNYDKASKFNTANIDIEKKEEYDLKEDGSNSKVKKLFKKDMNYDVINNREPSVNGIKLRIPAKNKKEAQNKLIGYYNQEMEEQITATLTVIGEPKLVSKRVIQVEGVGRYSGMYFVKSVNHLISEDGYVSTAKLTRNSSFEDMKDRFSQNVLNTLVNKSRLSVGEFLEKYPKSIFKRLYGT